MIRGDNNNNGIDDDVVSFISTKNVRAKVERLGENLTGWWKI
jgi:hypothetical protein